MDLLKKITLSKEAYFKLFLVCTLPVHVWAYVILLNAIPAMLMQMSFWRMLSVAAYVLNFALVESFFVFGVLFLVSLPLPEKIFNLRFLYLGSLLVFAGSIPVLFTHLYNQWDVEILGLKSWIALWSFVSLCLFGLAVFLLKRYARLRELFHTGIERLGFLSSFYLVLDILGLFVILFRNIVS